MRSNVSLTKLFMMDIAFFEMPVSVRKDREHVRASKMGVGWGEGFYGLARTRVDLLKDLVDVRREGFCGSRRREAAKRYLVDVYRNEPRKVRRTQDMYSRSTNSERERRGKIDANNVHQDISILTNAAALAL